MLSFITSQNECSSTQEKRNHNDYFGRILWYISFIYQTKYEYLNNKMEQFLCNIFHSTKSKEILLNWIMLNQKSFFVLLNKEWIKHYLWQYSSTKCEPNSKWMENNKRRMKCLKSTRLWTHKHVSWLTPLTTHKQSTDKLFNSLLSYIRINISVSSTPTVHTYIISLDPSLLNNTEWSLLWQRQAVSFPLACVSFPF